MSRSGARVVYTNIHDTRVHCKKEFNILTKARCVYISRLSFIFLDVAFCAFFSCAVLSGFRVRSAEVDSTAVLWSHCATVVLYDVSLLWTSNCPAVEADLLLMSLGRADGIFSDAEAAFECCGSDIFGHSRLT